MPAECLVTVLVPVHEYDPVFLHAAVRSLQQQTIPTWRALVIAEPDRHQLFASELAPELADPRITLISNEGRNLAGAYNTGMRRAETMFVAILLGDDMWAPDAVAVLERNIRGRPDVDFFHSARRIVDADGVGISSVHPARHDVTLGDFATTSPVKHLLCWRRELGLAAGGMDEQSRSVGPDDLDFPWVMAEHGAAFGAIDECLYLHRDHREHFRLTTHLPRSVHRRELARIFRKHGVPRSLARRRIPRPTARICASACTGRRSSSSIRETLGLQPRRPWRERYR